MDALCEVPPSVAMPAAGVGDGRVDAAAAVTIAERVSSTAAYVISIHRPDPQYPTCCALGCGPLPCPGVLVAEHVQEVAAEHPDDDERLVALGIELARWERLP